MILGWYQKREKMKKKHYDVIVATPGISVLNHYVKSLLDTFAYLTKNKISYLWANRPSSHVALAREATVMNSNFMDITSNQPLLGEATYNKIIWIDSDISWTPENFMQLYNSELDIVSGVYLNDQYQPMFTHNSKNIKELLQTTEPFEIKNAGFGFIAIKQGVFETIPRPWFGTEYSKYFKDNKQYLVPYGEDYSFGIKAKRAGYKIFVDPTVKVTHHKMVDISVPSQKPD